MAYIPDQSDPFYGGDKAPSLSWKDLPVGAVFSCQVLEPPKLLHSRNFETNQPDYWDPPANTQPKMSAVVNVLVLAGPHSAGEKRSIWALKPSNLFAAIAKAQEEAGCRLAPGGTLHLKFVGETPHENKRYSPIKNYLARYEPGTLPQADPFVQAPSYAAPIAPPTPAPRPQPVLPGTEHRPSNARF